jgi:hypothetical protein
MKMIGRATRVLAVAARLGSDARAQPATHEPHTYMRNNEAFVVAVARIRARPEALVDAVRKIETFRSGGRVLQIGRFAASPRIEDLRPLAVDPQDLDDFSKCRVGNCDIQAPAQSFAACSWARSWAR